MSAYLDITLKIEALYRAEACCRRNGKQDMADIWHQHRLVLMERRSAMSLEQAEEAV